MSVSKWAYTTDCDGHYCPGDCDWRILKYADRDSDCDDREDDNDTEQN